MIKIEDDLHNLLVQEDFSQNLSLDEHDLGIHEYMI